MPGPICIDKRSKAFSKIARDDGRKSAIPPFDTGVHAGAGSRPLPLAGSSHPDPTPAPGTAGRPHPDRLQGDIQDREANQRALVPMRKGFDPVLATIFVAGALAIAGLALTLVL